MPPHRPLAHIARRAPAASALLIGAVLAACAPTMEEPSAAAPTPPPAAPTARTPQGQIGGASYYARRFSGRRMASGRRFDPQSDSVAHRTLPFGTVVRVTNLDNGRTVTATVEDRGPFHRGRIIDLSPRLAAQIGMIAAGTAQVQVTPVEVAEAPE